MFPLPDPLTVKPGSLLWPHYLEHSRDLGEDVLGERLSELQNRVSALRYSSDPLTVWRAHVAATLWQVLCEIAGLYFFVATDYVEEGEEEGES